LNVNIIITESKKSLIIQLSNTKVLFNEVLYEENDFVQISKNLTKSRSDSNFIGPSK